jgi:hypothetical protein
MEVVDYVTHSDLSSNNNYGAIIENIADFAEDHGWTINEKRIGVQWAHLGSNQYGWVSGSEVFIQLTCNDIKRPKKWMLLSAESKGSAVAYEQPYYSIDYLIDDTAGYSTTNYRHPFLQVGHIQTNMRGFNCSYVFNGLKQWIFGNERWILNIIQRNATVCASAFFGIPSLINEDSPLLGHVMWKTGINPDYSAGTYFPSGDEELLAGPWSVYLSGGNGTGYPHGGDNVYGFCGTNIGYLSYAGTGLSSSYSGTGFTMQHLLKTQSWSGKRTILVPLIYSNPAPTTIFSPFAYMPIGMVRFSGLDIGQVLTYGSEEYKVFPFNSAFSPEGSSGTGRHCAWAVRIK